MSNKKSRILLTSIVVILAAVFALNLFLMLVRPRLYEISPDDAGVGEIITITGQFLGAFSARSTLSIGGRRVTASNILEWEDDRISFRLPEGMRSGDVMVELPQGSSNPLLLTNTDTIPVILDDSQNRGYAIELVPSSAQSLWRLDFTGYAPSEIHSLSFYFDDTAIAEQNIRFSDNSAFVYISYNQLVSSLPSDGRIEALLEPVQDEDQLLELLNGRLHIQSGGETIFDSSLDYLQIRNGSEETLFDSSSSLFEGGDAPENSGENAVDGESNDPLNEGEGDTSDLPLFTWKLNFPRIGGESGLVPGEYRLWAPVLGLHNGGFRIRAALPGTVSLLPEHARLLPDTRVLRYFPRESRIGRPGGTVFLDYFGEVPSAIDYSDILEQSTDSYDAAPELAFLYSDFITEAEDFLLDSRQRDSLRTALSAYRDGLSISREMLNWFASESMPGEQKLSAYVDELRRRDIGARLRRGLRVIGADDYEFALWVEVFLPRWGWLALYDENFQEAVPFGAANYRYIALPQTEAFPRLRDEAGNNIFMDVSLLQNRSMD